MFSTIPTPVRTAVSLFALGLACLGSAHAAVLTLGTMANPADYGADCTFACVNRYQQIYRASEFVAGPINLTRVSFFAYPRGNTGSSWNGTSTWQMTLSTSSAAVGALSTTFNNNVGGNAAVFATQTFSGTPAFNDLVSFNGAFQYDATMGNLLVDILRTNGPAQGVRLQANDNNGGVFDRAYATGNVVTADDANESYGNRTQFEFTNAVPVPEPGTLALVAAGLALAAGRRRALRKS